MQSICSNLRTQNRNCDIFVPEAEHSDRWKAGCWQWTRINCLGALRCNPPRTDDTSDSSNIRHVADLAEMAMADLRRHHSKTSWRQCNAATVIASAAAVATAAPGCHLTRLLRDKATVRTICWLHRSSWIRYSKQRFDPSATDRAGICVHVVNLCAARAHAHVPAREACSVLGSRHADHTLFIAGRVDAVYLLSFDFGTVHKQPLLQDLCPTASVFRPL